MITIKCYSGREYNTSHIQFFSKAGDISFNPNYEREDKSQSWTPCLGGKVWLKIENISVMESEFIHNPKFETVKNSSFQYELKAELLEDDSIAFEDDGRITLS